MGSTAPRGTLALTGLALGLLFGACSREGRDDTTEEPLPFELSREECDNLIEIDTQSVQVKQVDGPGKSQQARDALKPQEANLADYSLTVTVEQRFENLLERPLVIESASATVGDPASGDIYQTAYDLEAPLQLASHESRELSFDVVIPAPQLSGSYLLGLLEGTALGMTIAPVLVVTVPDSDNCGFPEGMEVRGKEGTVEVRRPVKPDPVLEGILGGVLKALLHG
jgi:hypothetical protein